MCSALTLGLTGCSVSIGSKGPSDFWLAVLSTIYLSFSFLLVLETACVSADSCLTLSYRYAYSKTNSRAKLTPWDQKSIWSQNIKDHGEVSLRVPNHVLDLQRDLRVKRYYRGWSRDMKQNIDQIHGLLVLAFIPICTGTSLTFQRL